MRSIVDFVNILNVVVLGVTHIVTGGLDAAKEIIEVSEKTGIDLVVMSTRGQSGLGR